MIISKMVIDGIEYDIKDEALALAIGLHVGSNGNSHSVANESNNGFMSYAQYLKLNGIAENANNYTLSVENIESVLNTISAKTTDNDSKILFIGIDGEIGYITMADISAGLKIYFDTLYLQRGTIVPDSVSVSIELSKYPKIKKTAALLTCTSLTITFPSTYDWSDEFVLYITTSTTPPTISIPAGITWVGGTPTFAANKTYVLSIQNGIGVVANV